MKKYILIYGFCGGVMIAVLKFIEYHIRIHKARTLVQDAAVATALSPKS